MLLLSWIAFWMEAGYFRTAWLNARVMTRCDFLRHCLQMSTIWLASKLTCAHLLASKLTAANQANFLQALLSSRKRLSEPSVKIDGLSSWTRNAFAIAFFCRCPLPG